MNNLKLATQALKQQKTIQPTQVTPTPAPTNSSWSAQDDADNLKIIVKTERKRQGLTQRNLARMSGMSQGSITRAEKHGWVSYYAWIRIAHALGKKLTIN